MPLITVSRQFGSGGSEVAERAWDALGFAIVEQVRLRAVAPSR
jgi:hypothetical protein